MREREREEGKKGERERERGTWREGEGERERGAPKRRKPIRYRRLT